MKEMVRTFSGSAIELVMDLWLGQVVVMLCQGFQCQAYQSLYVTSDMVVELCQGPQSQKCQSLFMTSIICIGSISRCTWRQSFVTGVSVVAHDVRWLMCCQGPQCQECQPLYVGSPAERRDSSCESCRQLCNEHSDVCLSHADYERHPLHSNITRQWVGWLHFRYVHCI